MIRRPPRSTPLYSSAASDVYKRQPDPCSRGPVSAKCFPVRLAEGSHGGRGRGAGTPLPKGSCRCIQSLYRLSPCSLLALLFLLHGCAVRPGHSSMNMHGHAEDVLEGGAEVELRDRLARPTCTDLCDRLCLAERQLLVFLCFSEFSMSMIFQRFLCLFNVFRSQNRRCSGGSVFFFND